MDRHAERANETITAEAAVAIVTTLHDGLGIEARTITTARADQLCNKSGTQTTTELLLLLARFHADVEDRAGSELLARFAVEFAALEATVV